ncbi:MAG: DUF1552 domain-containing protein [Kofleriaceae bacterium]|nr:DUF1552 domain-containing protein [Kofleriaceae bacterium]
MSSNSNNNRKKFPQLSRRGFIGGMGAAGASLFLPSSIKASPRPAPGDSGRPKRIIFFMTQLGWNPSAFRIKPPGAPDELLLGSDYHPDYRDNPDNASWDIPLQSLPLDAWSDTLAPLYPLREHVIALDGLSMASIGADRYGDAHAKGYNHSLTGFPSSEYITGQKAKSGAPSLDRRIARYLREQNPNLTDLTGLNINMTNWRNSGGIGFHNFFWDHTQQGELVEAIGPTDPRILFNRLFPGGEGEDTPVDAGQRSVLDLISARYAHSYPQLSRDDRNKLALHKDILSDVQQRLDQLSGGSCSASSLGGYDDNGTSFEQYDSNVENFLDLLVTAMACDVTRVAGIQWANGGFRDVAYGAGNLDFHEWYSHGTNPTDRWFGVDERVSQANYDKYLDASPVIANKNRHHVEMMVRLANKLREVPDGDGQTMFDNTLIVMMDEISHGSHGHDQWPVIMLGGFGGSFRNGRYVRFPRNLPNPGLNGMGFVGKPHNHLLVSLAQAMGLPMEDMGLQEVFGYHANSGTGERINLRGRLEELY